MALAGRDLDPSLGLLHRIPKLSCWLMAIALLAGLASAGVSAPAFAQGYVAEVVLAVPYEVVTDRLSTRNPNPVPVGSHTANIRLEILLDTEQTTPNGGITLHGYDVSSCGVAGACGFEFQPVGTFTYSSWELVPHGTDVYEADVWFNRDPLAPPVPGQPLTISAQLRSPDGEEHVWLGNIASLPGPAYYPFRWWDSPVLSDANLVGSNGLNTTTPFQISVAGCGDGNPGTNEDCDDGNFTAGDGCSFCEIEEGWDCGGSPSECEPTCGNGTIDPGEECDDANPNVGDGCSSCEIDEDWSCTGEPSDCDPMCGNGWIDPGEQCDDVNADPGDGCASCEIELDWICRGEPSTCSLAANCGDGQSDAGEECDDGNPTPGDGCNLCKVEPAWSCSSSPSICSTTCFDGALEPHEQCDDGNSDDGDGCTACEIDLGWECVGEPSSCSLPSCGNGAVDAGEECDDENVASGDGCTDLCREEDGWNCTGAPSQCTLASECGNGVVEPGEDCDDGNVLGGDACPADCIDESTADACPSVPVPACLPSAAGKGKLNIKTKKSGATSLVWAWQNKETTLSKTRLGDPGAETEYQLCGYIQDGETSEKFLDLVLPPGPTWKTTSNSVKLKQKTANGPRTVSLKSTKKGDKLKLKTPIPDPPALPLSGDSDLVLQLRSDTGGCWQSKFGESAKKNLPGRFGDSSDPDPAPVLFSAALDPWSPSVFEASFPDGSHLSFLGTRDALGLPESVSQVMGFIEIGDELEALVFELEPGAFTMASGPEGYSLSIVDNLDGTATLTISGPDGDFEQVLDGSGGIPGSTAPIPAARSAALSTSSEDFRTGVLRTIECDQPVDATELRAYYLDAEKPVKRDPKDRVLGPGPSFHQLPAPLPAGNTGEYVYQVPAAEAAASTEWLRNYGSAWSDAIADTCLSAGVLFLAGEYTCGSSVFAGPAAPAVCAAALATLSGVATVCILVQVADRADIPISLAQFVSAKRRQFRFYARSPDGGVATTSKLIDLRRDPPEVLLDFSDGRPDLCEEGETGQCTTERRSEVLNTCEDDCCGAPEGGSICNDPQEASCFQGCVCATECGDSILPGLCGS